LRILLFGGNGQIGTELQRSLAPLGEVVVATRNGRLANGTTCEAADFGEPATLASLIARIAPDIVVNAAAYTAVDAAEDDAATAFLINAQAPGAIAEACAARNLLMVHYSTDYVFDGNATRPYREDDPASPINVYGASKLAGEQAVQSSGTRHLIFRTAWVYAAHGRNFLTTILRLAKDREELRVVADQVGTPTPAALVADVTAERLAHDPHAAGIWHLAASGETTWHGFATALVDCAWAHGLLSRKPAIMATKSTHSQYRAKRPAYAVLDCAKLSLDRNSWLPEWQELVSEVILEI
jgi:dTDP-4-dehydrorhamnose reductase